MFSQRDEEKYILKYFKNQVGRFLDIGAYDGQTFSNVRQLALQGWGGVLIEPMTEMHAVLVQRYSDARFTILHTALGLKDETRTFYNFAGDAIGSFDKTHADLWANKATQYTEKQYEIISIKTLFSKIGYDFEFINIDTEGWSYDILRHLPFSNLRKLKMICVEFDGQLEKVTAVVTAHKYIKYHQTCENIIFIRS